MFVQYHYGNFNLLNRFKRIAVKTVPILTRHYISNFKSKFLYSKAHNLSLLKGINKICSTGIAAFITANVVNNNITTVHALDLKTKDNLIEKADELYDQVKYEELYELLIRHKDNENDEILWRLARATYEKARATDNSNCKKTLYKDALSLLDKANEINSNNFAVHKWLAIIMDCFYTLEGTKAKISHLFDMKHHMEKACQLKPKDGTSWYVLGLWYFGVANIAWYERKAAALFFATPPTASYEDALHYFYEAEKAEPGFYSKNDLMIGKCLYYMGEKEEAKRYFLKVKKYETKTEDDREAHLEADKFLAGMK